MLEVLVGVALFAAVFYWSIQESRTKAGQVRAARYRLDGEGISQYLGPVNWLKTYGISALSVCDVKYHPSAQILADLPEALRQAAREAYKEGLAPGAEMAAAIGREEPLPPGYLFYFVLRKKDGGIPDPTAGDTLEMWVVAHPKAGGPDDKSDGKAT